MALRFQRRIRVMPGVRVNVSKTGLGLSVGPRGLTTSIGPRGMQRSVGLPGTGISYRERIGGGARRTPSAPQAAAAPTIAVEVEADGSVHFRLPDGSDAPAPTVRRIREENAEAIAALIEAAVAKLNAELTACLSIHLETPAPDYRPMAILDPFPEEPEPPALRRVGFWDRVFFRRRVIEAANEELTARHRHRMQTWSAALDERARLEAELRSLNDQVQDGDPDAQARVLESRLAEIAWAKPTNVAFDFGDDASTLDLDIDLPTIEELPEREAVAPARGLNVRWKARSAAQRRKDFAYVAHAALFRVIGEAFACLPRLRQVTASGFTQREDKATGRALDEYVVSARVSREKWSRIDLASLGAVDVAQALERFELVRDMTRGGELRRIEPLDQGGSEGGSASAVRGGKTASR